MKRLLLLMLLLSTLAAQAPLSSAAMKGSDVTSCPPNMPNRVQTLEGLFRVHVVCDHVLFEIPKKLLNRDMLINTEFAALSTGSDFVAPGSVVDSRVIRWVQRGNKIYLETVKYEMWALNMPSLQRGVEAASLRTVLKAFDAVAEGEDGAPLIDVTGLFVTEVPEGFAREFMQHFRMRSVDPKRSYIENVKAFPENIGIRFHQTWVPDLEDLARAPEDGEEPVAPALGFIFHTSLLLLPEQPMRPRYWDPRVGYFAAPFDDYGTQEHGGVRRAFIQRYRLEKKEPRAKISDPVKPIVFYLADEIPDRWQPYIKQAVEDWQVVFEQVGFRKAILARPAPTAQEDPDWHPDDVRYNVIRWTPSGRQNAMGPAVIDPRSGEVISSHAIFWNDVLKLAETWYFTQVGALDPRAKKLPLPDELMGELLRYVVSHEIGHALGLRHNFKAPSMVSTDQLRSAEWTHKWGTSASIMSYARFNYVAQPGDNARLIPKFGPYDYFAIEWGYKPLGEDMSCDDEWPALDQMAARQIENPLLSFGGEDSAGALDPTVNENVLGSDPIAAAALGLRNIDRVAPLLLPATTRKGGSYERLSDKYEALITQRHRELTAVSKIVGGVMETRYQAGRGGPPFKPVDPERQRAAVQFLIDQAFIEPKALLDPQILQRITPSGGSGPLQGSNVDLLRRLIDPLVFQRMAEARAEGKAGYIGIDLLEDLNDGLFSELGAKEPMIALYRRELQRNYITLLLVSTGTVSDPQRQSNAIESVYLDSGSITPKFGRHLEERGLYSPLAEVAKQYRRGSGRPSEFRAALRSGVGHLYKKIDEAVKLAKDPETLAHLRDLRSQLAQVP